MNAVRCMLKFTKFKNGKDELSYEARSKDVMDLYDKSYMNPDHACNPSSHSGLLDLFYINGEGH